MKRSSLLLPSVFRLPGLILLAAGSVFGIMRFWFDIKPKFLHMKVYAIYSEYLGEKYFHFIRDNLSEELVGVLLVLGAWMVAFSRDKNETDEKAVLRSRAMYISAWLQMIFLLLSLVLTYGIAFIYMLMMYMLLFPATYFIIYRIFSAGSKWPLASANGLKAEAGGNI
jgi:hypothetical protein